MPHRVTLSTQRSQIGKSEGKVWSRLAFNDVVNDHRSLGVYLGAALYAHPTVTLERQLPH
jgi:hypothetical protein